MILQPLQLLYSFPFIFLANLLNSFLLFTLPCSPFHFHFTTSSCYIHHIIIPTQVKVNNCQMEWTLFSIELLKYPR